jgi:hypothetical protein
LEAPAFRSGNLEMDGISGRIRSQPNGLAGVKDKIVKIENKKLVALY